MSSWPKRSQKYTNHVLFYVLASLMAKLSQTPDSSTFNFCIQFINVSVSSLIVIFPHMAAAIPTAVILLLSTLSNYPTLIMERIVPHRSTRRRRGGNHPFVWVSVCNDFSLLLPYDLHVVYKCVRSGVLLLSISQWTVFSHVTEAETNSAITSAWVFPSFWFNVSVKHQILPLFIQRRLPQCDWQQWEATIKSRIVEFFLILVVFFTFSHNIAVFLCRCIHWAWITLFFSELNITQEP